MNLKGCVFGRPLMYARTHVVMVLHVWFRMILDLGSRVDPSGGSRVQGLTCLCCQRPEVAQPGRCRVGCCWVGSWQLVGILARRRLALLQPTSQALYEAELVRDSCSCGTGAAACGSDLRPRVHIWELMLVTDDTMIHESWWLMIDESWWLMTDDR